MTNNNDEMFYFYNGDDWRLFDPDLYLTKNIELKVNNKANDYSSVDMYKDILEHQD